MTDFLEIDWSIQISIDFSCNQLSSFRSAHWHKRFSVLRNSGYISIDISLRFTSISQFQISKGLCQSCIPSRSNEGRYGEVRVYKALNYGIITVTLQTSKPRSFKMKNIDSQNILVHQGRVVASLDIQRQVHQVPTHLPIIRV